MKVLTTSAAIEFEIKRLIRTCERLRWAVAWASFDFPLFHVLAQHRDKIEQTTVGIHFYQTHPDFISEFADHPGVGFVMNPDGVFHPKVYWFSLHDGTWECVVGSPNFTNGAFSTNDEFAVLLSSTDVGSEDAVKDLLAVLDEYQTAGKKVSEADLAIYRQLWRHQQRRLESLSGNYANATKKSKFKKSPLEVPLFTASWKEYFDSVKEDEEHTTEGRLAVLEEARRLFQTHVRFKEIGDEDRKGIGGFKVSTEPDWLWFGSMIGHGYFKQAINQNSHGISAALDEIPLDGAVSEDDFDRYVATIRGSFQNAGIATATRLLAMKRPDYFVCLDTKNRDRLCKEFEIPKTVDLKDYWEKVVARITDSIWWNSSEPVSDLEKRIWHCRAAFLDVRFYEP